MCKEHGDFEKICPKARIRVKNQSLWIKSETLATVHPQTNRGRKEMVNDKNVSGA